MLMGHDVQIALTAATGLQIMTSFHPEVVLCDLGLPDLDGYSFARQVRAHDALNTTYLVAHSGYAQPSDVDRAKAAGFDEHLAKPATLTDLDRVLGKLPPHAADPRPGPRNALH